MRLRAARVVLVIALVVAGCTGDGDAPDDTADSPSPAAGNVTAKPEFEIPGEEPPNELEARVLVEGEGDTAEGGDTVTVHYVGKAWSTGEEFASSWDRDEPFVFELGVSSVIEGWERGIEGMRVGERRMLVIPPDQAYGDQGAGSIGPGETLVFVVDLLSVEGP